MSRPRDSAGEADGHHTNITFVGSPAVGRHVTQRAAGSDPPGAVAATEAVDLYLKPGQ
jgi:hypothetical protein